MSAIPNILEGYVDEETLATATGRSTRTIKRWRNEPDGLPYVKLGCRVYFNVESTKRWIAAKETQRNPSRRRGAGR